MNNTITHDEFTQIFINSYPTYVYNLHKKAFDHCVTKYDLPYLSKSEESCINQYTKKYLLTIDSTIVYFTKKIVE